MKITIPLDSETEKNLISWLEGSYDEESKASVRSLMEKDPKELIDSFYCRLNFGTGGLRGIVGPGTNRMNRYTLGFANQGLANYLKKQFPKETLRCLIGYDSRLSSESFAKRTAEILSANGIEVFLFNSLRPTPMVSFGCREYKCHAAVMITASHNPKNYNGYKVYWSDGAQVLPPHDKGIIDEVYHINSPDQIISDSKDKAKIHLIGQEIHEVYHKAIIPLQATPEQNQKEGKRVHVVYTNLHGTGITMLPGGLNSWGFNNISYVEEQKEPDGSFPTVDTPNPEEQAALLLGIKKLLEEQADILLGTDADADRLGAVVRHQGKAILLNGNQIASVCLYHLCENLKKQGKLDSKAAFVKTIVTTELFQRICDFFERPCFNVLTGFKYIGELIHHWEQENKYHYFFGGEESYGYLLGTHARDKDATVSACLLVEAALSQKLQGKTLIDLLYEIYEKLGVFRESLESVVLKGKEGKEKIESIMAKLRSSPPKEVAGQDVVVIEDYLEQKRLDLQKNSSEPLTLPKSNVLLYRLKDGSKVVVRPSGTEPKIKLYLGVHEEASGNVEQSIKVCDEKLKALKNALMEIFA